MAGALLVAAANQPTFPPLTPPLPTANFRPPLPKNQRKRPMSQHRSLKLSKTVGARRNVLKRFERVKLLRKREELKEGTSPVGLPKTKPEE